MKTDPQTTIDKEAESKREIETRDQEWFAIYDACAGGNGATGFALFEKALHRAFLRGLNHEG